MVRWIKSMRSADNGNCVEIAHLDGRVAVRDSKDPGGPMLSFSDETWRVFIADVREGVFDLSEGV